MDPAFRHRLFAAGFRAISATRADRWLAPAARGRGVVLMFHHVRPWVERAFAPNRLLEITPAFLDRVLVGLRREGYEIVPLDAVPDRLAGPGQTPFAALTFDDGYRDNVEYALPVLRRHGAPWTMFVTTGFADGTGRLWWLELEEAVRRLDRIEVAIDDEQIALNSSTEREKARAFDQIYRRLRAGPEGRLRAMISRLAAQAGVDGAALTRGLCLDWDEVAQLAAEPGVTIGAHTLTHRMLAKHPEAAARDEIASSRRILAERLGRPIRHFAYPVGDPTSAGPRDFALAAEAGFATACTTRPGHLFPEHRDHLHALPRVSINGHHQTDAALDALLSGLPFLLWNRGRRLNVA
ncbi:MAG TPA: polysaccharide deacetylase family protein [Beijerinckiaceae bacterium]|jgi:peptidoglycan/xylan/chitin deacetylase (PgdA/CDA1 family)